jgi:hypothetical protein
LLSAARVALKTAVIMENKVVLISITYKLFFHYRVGKYSLRVLPVSRSFTSISMRPRTAPLFFKTLFMVVPQGFNEGASWLIGRVMVFPLEVLMWTLP